MTYDSIAAWFVWVIPLIACLFVPVVAKRSDKLRNYFVIAIAVVVAFLAFSMVPGIFFGNGQVEASSSVNWIPGLNAGVFIDPLSVLFTCAMG